MSLAGQDGSGGRLGTKPLLDLGLRRSIRNGHVNSDEEFHRQLGG